MARSQIVAQAGADQPPGIVVSPVRLTDRAHRPEREEVLPTEVHRHGEGASTQRRLVRRKQRLPEHGVEGGPELPLLHVVAGCLEIQVGEEPERIVLAFEEVLLKIVEIGRPVSAGTHVGGAVGTIGVPHAHPLRRPLRDPARRSVPFRHVIQDIELMAVVELVRDKEEELAIGGEVQVARRGVYILRKRELGRGQKAIRQVWSSPSVCFTIGPQTGSPPATGVTGYVKACAFHE